MNSIIQTILLVFTCSGLTLAQTCTGPLTLPIQGSSTGQAITVDASAVDIYCAESSDGSIDLNTEGGSPSYQYSWSNGTSAEDIDQVTQGVYTVTVSDANDCTLVDSFEVVTIDPLLDDIEIATSTSCGACHLSDGTATYVYNTMGEYLVELVDQPDGNALGTADVCVNVANGAQSCNGQPVLERSWTIDASSGETTVRLFMIQEELESLATAAGFASLPDFLNSGSICVQKYDGGSETCDDYTTFSEIFDFSIYEYDPVNDIWAVEFNVNSFSSFYISICESSLPIDLLSFDGTNHGDHNILRWTIAGYDLSEFQIERATSAFEFEKIGTISNITEQNYTFTDDDLSHRLNYYRLKMLDYDGTYTYSPTIVLQSDIAGKLEVRHALYPSELIFISTFDHERHYDIKLLDISGRLVRTYDLHIAADSQTRMDISSLSGGIYIVSVQDRVSKMTFSKKIVNVR